MPQQILHNICPNQFATIFNDWSREIKKTLSTCKPKIEKGWNQKSDTFVSNTHMYVQSDASEVQSDTSFFFSVVQSDTVVVACDAIYSGITFYRILTEVLWFQD